MTPVITYSGSNGSFRIDYPQRTRRSTRSSASRDTVMQTVWIDRERSDALRRVAQAEHTTVQRLLSEGIDAVLINRKTGGTPLSARFPLVAAE